MLLYFYYKKTKFFLAKAFVGWQNGNVKAQVILAGLTSNKYLKRMGCKLLRMEARNEA